MTDETLYFRRRENGQEIGPFAAVYLPKFVETGKLQRTDEVRAAGSTTWYPAESVTGLFRPEDRSPPSS